jgi:hypothetical protein
MLKAFTFVPSNNMDVLCAGTNTLIEGMTPLGAPREDHLLQGVTSFYLQHWERLPCSHSVLWDYHGLHALSQL